MDLVYAMLYFEVSILVLGSTREGGRGFVADP